MSEAQDRDMLAAEYAIGCLEGEEAAAAERLVREDPEFSRAVAAWQKRLVPLAALASPVPPPDTLWQRIEATALPSEKANVVPLRRVRFWQFTTAGALAIAAGLAAFMLVRQPEPARVAILTPLTGGGPVLVATAGDGTLTIRPNGAISVANDRDLELWALRPQETKPRSLGVMPAEGRRLAASLPSDTQLMVSLEPRGGSPTGAPTGPVLYGGKLTAVN